MQEAVALAHLSVATGSGDDDEDIGVPWPPVSDGMPRQPDWGGETGRGLQIVAALSHVWGWSPIAGHGKAVWAVLRDP